MADVTVLVLTHERIEDFRRTMTCIEQFFNSDRFQFIVLDNDSSPSIMAEKKRICQSLGIEYQDYTGDTFPEKLYKGAKQVETPFVCFWADDDLLHYQGILEAVDFLKQNPDFSSCTGKYLAMKFEDSGKIHFWDHYPQDFDSIEEESPLNRLFHYHCQFRDLFYAVHRTEAFQTAFKEVVNVVEPNNVCFVEQLYVGLMIIYGKVMYLPESLQIIRQVGQSHQYYNDQFLPLEQMIALPTYSEQYQRLRACMVKHLIKEVPVESIEHLNHAFDLIFARYLSGMWFVETRIGSKFLALDIPSIHPESHLTEWEAKNVAFMKSKKAHFSSAEFRANHLVILNNPDYSELVNFVRDYQRDIQLNPLVFKC